MMTASPKTMLLSAAAITALATGFQPTQAPAASRIGAVSAVNQNVEGTPPQAATRSLSLGDGLSARELIESSTIGSGQFLFDDQTTLTIAQNSRIVLDEYVYDPETKKGTVSITMTKGILRFVGGRITKDKDAVITTPTATIGIRGGMAVIIVEDDGTTRAMHVAGEYTRVTHKVTDAAQREAEGETITISRSNGVVRSDQTDISFVGVADQEFVRTTTIALTGRGQAGQAILPRDQDVTDSGLAQVNSGETGAARRKPISTNGESDSADTAESIEIIEIEETEEIEETFITEEIFIVETMPGAIPLPPGPTLLPGVTGGAGFSFAGIPGLTTDANGDALFFDQVFEGSRIGRTASGDELSIPTSPGFFSFSSSEDTSSSRDIDGNGFFDPIEEFTYAAFAVSDGSLGAFVTGLGSGPLTGASAPGQRVARTYELSQDLFTDETAFLPLRIGAGNPMSGHTGLTLLSNDGGSATGGNAAVIGGYLDIRNGGSETGFGVITGLVDASGAGEPSFGDFFEGSFVSGGSQTRVEAAVFTLEDDQGHSAYGTDAAYFALNNAFSFDSASEASLTVAGNGAEDLYGSATVATRTDVTSISSTPDEAASGGYVSVIGSDLGPGNRFVGRSLGHDGVMGGVSSITNRALATFQIDSFQSGEPTFVAPSLIPSELFNLSVSFGGDEGRSATISDDQFAMRHASLGINTANFTEGLQDSDRQAGQGAFRGALASAAYVGDGGIFPDAVNPQSDHISWGWWAGEFRHDPNQIGVSTGALNADQRFHIGTWIAGDPSDLQNLPAAGTADYAGFAAIAGYDNGVQFVDGAAFLMTYDFGSGTGTANFSDILGENAVVSLDPAGSNSHYTGSGGIVIDGRSGSLNVDGSFFESDALFEAATGGSLSIQTDDQTLTGAGVFAGDIITN